MTTTTIEEAQTIEQEAIAKADASGSGAPAVEKRPDDTASFQDEDAELAKIEAEQAAIDAKNVEGLEKGTKVDEKPVQTGQQQDTPAGGSAPADKTAGRTADPKDAAIIALRKQNQQLQLKLAETTGAARVLEQMARSGANGSDQTTTQEPAQVQTPAQQIAALDDQILSLADDLEAGKIDMRAYETQRMQLWDQRVAVQSEGHGNTRSVQHDAAVTDTAVQDHLHELIQKHPYIANMTHEQLAPYQARAQQVLELEGKMGHGKNRDDMTLRERMADLVRQDFVKMLGVQDTSSSPGSGTGGQPTGAPAVPALSDAARAREAKLVAAANHPVNIGNIGAPATGIGLTPAQAVATLNAFGGDEDAAIRWMEAHPEISSLR